VPQGADLQGLWSASPTILKKVELPWFPAKGAGASASLGRRERVERLVEALIVARS
jgi:hypothetical protein